MARWHASDAATADWNVKFESMVARYNELPLGDSVILEDIVYHFFESPFSVDVEALAHKPVFNLGEIKGKNVAEVCRGLGIEGLPDYFSL